MIFRLFHGGHGVLRTLRRGGQQSGVAVSLFSEGRTVIPASDLATVVVDMVRDASIPYLDGALAVKPTWPYVKQD